ncbi:MAG: DUF2061 domain-containing protein [Gammaproteobacteria bacterium]|nr:DUF2061 domain-containing protein [Gammaproteobacteria bacterium]MBT5202338.1 DUF2061 domain-containing protein [Gammaproteobacteria bacterium]MBT5602817.1 DUF2061 domain-containing protein [Gammaproteobacteria bacterium]MBT6247196.1 DUF2061 domain-containing protein [Gammaproteobacteria bacterium]
MANESRLRSLSKAISWRVIATLTTMLITWWVTGNINAALLVGSVEFFAKFVIYYLHERVWLKIP